MGGYYGETSSTQWKSTTLRPTAGSWWPQCRSGWLAGHAAAAMGGKIHVTGGDIAAAQREVVDSAYVYDPRANAWTQLPSMDTVREGQPRLRGRVRQRASSTSSAGRHALHTRCRSTTLLWTAGRVWGDRSMRASSRRPPLSEPDQPNPVALLRVKVRTRCVAPLRPRLWLAV